MTSKIFVAVAGNIGSGKSSLTRLLSSHYGWNAFFESVDDNPYLADFYADMKRWSFNLQVYFLSKRFNDHKKIVEGTESVIQDRSIYEDAEIFAKNLHDIGKMDQRDYTNYVELYRVMMQYLQPPDLLIYLDARIETLLKQIARDRKSVV
jgi:deoxyadenosine/deoxycytidine kinase